MKKLKPEETMSGLMMLEKADAAMAPTCNNCKFMFAKGVKLEIVKDQLTPRKLFPCRRYPQTVYKEWLSDTCGEFSKKEK